MTASRFIEEYNFLNPFKKVAVVRINMILKFRMVIVLLFLLPFAVNAQAYDPPSVRLIQGGLISPGSAWTYYGAATTHSDSLATVFGASTTRPRSTQIQTLARALSAGGKLPTSEFVSNVHKYVRNNVRVEYRFGLGKGATAAIIDQSGTPFDQAQIMADILREGGVSVTYQVGTITLDATKFGQWTGLVRNLNSTQQTFQVEARSACEFLASGGFPATVNGYSDCGQIPNGVNLTSATFGHIWLSINGKLYDPSIKIHRLYSAIDYAEKAGCGSLSANTCGATAVSNLLADSLSGTLGGAQYRQRLNQGALNSFLQARTGQLENWLLSNNPNINLMEVIGGKKIDLSAPISINTTLMYPSQAQYSWTQEIPDQFRTKTRITAVAVDVTLYLDDINGENIQFGDVYFGIGPNYYKRAIVLGDFIKYIDFANIAVQSHSVNLTIDHPYGALSGTYGDETTSKYLGSGIQPNTTSTFRPIPAATLVFSVGNNGSKAVQLISEKAPNTIGVNENFTNKLRVSAPLAKQFLEQITLAKDVIEAVSQTDMQVHHILGAVVLGSIISSTTSQITETISGTTGSDVMDLHFAAHIVGKENFNKDRQAAFTAFGTFFSGLESSIVEQVMNTWSGFSGLTLFPFFNTKNIPFLSVNSANISTVLPILQNYSADRKTRLQQLVQAGMSLVLPRNGNLGDIGSGVITTGGSTLAYSNSKMGYLINELIKGGSAAVGAEDPVKSIVNYTKQKDASIYKYNVPNINLFDGSLNIASIADIPSGSQGVPYSLPFERSYSSLNKWALYRTQYSAGYGSIPADIYTGFDLNTASRMPLGWKHNYQIWSTLSNDGVARMDEGSALSSAVAIVGSLVLLDLARTESLDNRLGLTFSQQWIIGQFIDNVVTVNMPSNTLRFIRRSDGSFIAPQGQPARVTVSGTRTGPINTGSKLAFSYHALSMTALMNDGTKLSFSPYGGPEIYNKVVVTLPTFKVDQIEYPSGYRVSFNYEFLDNSGQSLPFAEAIHRLNRISNSSGRSLDFSYSYMTAPYGSFPQGAWHVSKALADDGRTALYSDGAPGTTTFDFSNYYTLSATAADGNKSKYALNKAGGKIYLPSDLSNPAFTIDANNNSAMASLTTDRLGRQSKYFSSRVATEGWSYGASIDAIDRLTQVEFDKRGGALVSIDSTSKIKKSSYDDVGRLIRLEMPEGDAVEYQYDVRGNKTRECRISKTRAGLPCNVTTDIVTSAAYVEGAGVYTCINLKTCNKPLYEIDARGNRTDYTWNATHGLIETITGPADSAGGRPLTNYVYSSFTGTDGAIFYLLTSKVEKINATQSTTTIYEYDATNKFVLKSSVVDSNGLNLRTCYRHDAAGNAVSKTEPKAGLGVCP
jgi:YD repeat-containing protein